VADNPGRFTLLAMPPSGEIFLATDAYGTTWLVHPPGAGGPDKISASAVGATIEEAVARHGWDRVEQSFPSWAKLDSARQRRAAKANPQRRHGVATFDEHDVRRVLRVVTSWMTEGDPARGRPALHRLLREAPVVRSNDELYEEVNRLLLRLDQKTNPPPFANLTPLNGARNGEALQRLRLPQAS
jgi:hypothetical protein